MRGSCPGRLSGVAELRLMTEERIMAVTIKNPYMDSGAAFWMAGNLHTHTTRSDGHHSPQETIDEYAAFGRYDFLALSDHNEPADLSGLDGRGMVLIPACEHSGAMGHVLSIGQVPRIATGLQQQVLLDAINAAGGIPVLCHPDWEDHFNHYSIDELRSLSSYGGIEIYNGSIEEDPGSPYALAKWDQLLADGRVVWGFASDDAHVAMGQGRGWCVVRVRERTAEAVMNALRNGSFYASTGVTIEKIEVSGARVRIVTKDAESISVLGVSGRRLKRENAAELEFDGAGYGGAHFRIECAGRGGRMAWTQPFFLDGEEVAHRKELFLRKPAIHAPRVERAPRLTGRMDDAIWSKAAVSAAFIRHADGGSPSVRTEMSVLAGGSLICFGFKCAEPEQESMRVTVREHGSGKIWTDDGIEIFMDVQGQAKTYFHVMVNADGFALIQECGKTAQSGRKMRVETAAGRDSSGFVLEIAVPLQDLGVDVSLPQKWGFNVVRNRNSGGEYLTWSFTGGRNHAPKHFGQLSF